MMAEAGSGLPTYRSRYSRQARSYNVHLDSVIPLCKALGGGLQQQASALPNRINNEAKKIPRRGRPKVPERCEELELLFEQILRLFHASSSQEERIAGEQ